MYCSPPSYLSHIELPVGHLRKRCFRMSLPPRFSLVVLDWRNDTDGFQGYTVTGVAQLPGSKYTCGEVEINDCHTQQQLEDFIADHRNRVRTGGKDSLLGRWEFLGRADA